MTVNNKTTELNHKYKSIISYENYNINTKDDSGVGIL